MTLYLAFRASPPGGPFDPVFLAVQRMSACGEHLGVSSVVFEEGQPALIATKEKALVDLIVVRRGRCQSLKQMREILFEDFRIEEEDLLDLEIADLERIYKARPHSGVECLIAVIREVKNEYSN